MSTQDRTVRGDEAAHSEGLEGGEAAVGAASGQVEPARLRAMQRRWIQRKANGGGSSAAAAIPGGAGAPLGGGVQSRMERTLGADLSGVRVHTGGDSAQAAEALGARAFTVGSDVHFGHGEFAPGSREGDRLLAHELTHVVQGQKSGVQRKAAPEGEGAGGEHGDHEAAGHEVSEPGDPAEHEADAMGDHAAEQLHGGDDKAGGEHGAAQGGGKKVSPEKPKVDAAAPSVGRKIFRAPKPDAAAGGAKPAAGNATPAAASATPQKSKEELAKEKQVALTTADMNALDGGDPKLALKVALALQTADKDVAAFPKNEAVKAFQVFVNARKQLIIDKCQEELAPLLAALDGIDEKAPVSADKLAELKKSPVFEKWSRNSICGPYTKDKHPRLELFSKTLDKKLAANHDAIEKQKQHQKEEEEKKQAAAANPQATATSSTATAAAHKPAGGGPNAGAPTQATPAAAATSSPTPTTTEAPSTGPAKTDAKTNAPPPPTPGAAATTSSSAATTGNAGTPHKDAPPHADNKPASAAATHAPATSPPSPGSTPSGTTSTPAATPAGAHDAKAADAHQSGAGDKTPPTSSNTAAATPQTSAVSPQGAPPAANQANELKKQELVLKKEVAITRVRTALAAAEDKWKIFGAALEVLNIGAMLAKGFLASHGIELPEEAVSTLKDAIGAVGKGKLTKAQVDALFAVVEIQSIQTVEEIDTLFSEADIKAASTHLHTLSAKLSQEEALKREALAAMKAKANAPKGAEKPKAPAEEKHDDKEGETKDSDAAATTSSSASDKDKSKDDSTKKGFGKRFKHAAEETYEKGVKGPVEAESDLEEKNPDFKIAAQQFGNVLDPAKTVVALGDVLKSHFKDLKAAKQAQAEAEKALETFIAEHGGKALPDSAAAVAKA